MGWGARFAGVLVVGLALSACGGAGPEGQVLPAATSDASSELLAGATASAAPASPTPSPKAAAQPTLPDVAKVHSPAGAEAFVRYWVSLANKAFGDGDVSTWRGLGLPGCKSCDKRIAAVERTYGSGGHIEGGDLVLNDLAATPVKRDERTLVLARVTASRETHLDSSGTLVSDHSGSTLRFVFYLDWRDGWKVAEIQLGVAK